MENLLTETKDGRPLRNVATLVIAEYADVEADTPAPLYVNLKYAPVTEEELADRVPVSFKAMSHVWQSIIAPLVEPVNTHGSANAPSTTTCQ